SSRTAIIPRRSPTTTIRTSFPKDSVSIPSRYAPCSSLSTGRTIRRATKDSRSSWIASSPTSMRSRRRRAIQNGARSISPRPWRAGTALRSPKPGSTGRSRRRARPPATISMTSWPRRRARAERQCPTPNGPICFVRFSSGLSLTAIIDGAQPSAALVFVNALEGFMGPSALSQSDTVIRPKSLSERLAAETPAPPEAMAERFAPGTQRYLNGASGRTIIEPQRLQGLLPEPVRSSNRALFVALLIISLVPTAIFLGLLWQGAIRLPEEGSTIFKQDRATFVETQQASLAAAPQVETEARPDIALTADSRIEAKPGEEVPFNIAIDSVDMLPAR